MVNLNSMITLISVMLFLIFLSIINLFFVKYKGKKKNHLIEILVKEIAQKVYEYYNKDDNLNLSDDNINLKNYKREKDIFLKVNEKLLISALNICSERIFVPLKLKNIYYYKGNKVKLLKYYTKCLKSKNKIKRHNGAFALRFYGKEGTSILAAFLGTEKSSSIRFKISESLLFTQEYDLIPLILDSACLEYKLKNEFKFSQYIAILQKHAQHVINTIISRYPYNKAETIIAIRLSRYFPNALYEKILIESLLSQDSDLLKEAASVIYHMLPTMLDSQHFLRNSDNEIRSYAINSLGKNINNLDRLFQFLIEPENEKYALEGIERLLGNFNDAKEKVLNLFFMLDDEELKIKLSKILEGYLPFWFSQKDWYLNQNFMEFISFCIKNGLIYNIVSFLNDNEDLKIEEILILKIINTLDILNFNKPNYESRVKIFEEIFSALNQDIYERYNFPAKKPIQKPQAPIAKTKDKPILLVLLSIFISLPIITFILSYKDIHFTSILNIIKSFTIFYIRFFGYYALVLNLISLLFLFLANIEIYRQQRLNFSKSYVNYFQKGVLPSISIIVPAFKEEATIVQNVRSLLALKYTSFEIIVVNDGSFDNTLKVLQKNFDLERVAFTLPDNAISTAPIIGVYKSKLYSNLIVIDKLNGGKADSLNAGINLSNCSYICGIDADSILEQDALIKAMTPFFENDELIIATGGKILPVNGCKVNNGSIIEIGISKNILSLFQILEYLRAFFVGRLGWSFIKSLLIISGAFGIFKKSSIFSIGGYMTARTSINQNTVGEDMELIVRLRRYYIEKKEKISINYSIDANCWTEVPESFKILRKQRDRWQRGLIEILMYHKKMIFNKNYKNIGLIALPYYLIFETLGPFYEVTGLVFSIFAIILNIFTLPLLLFLFLTSILLGIFISIISLAIAERNVLYFKWYEDLSLILIGLLESFGFRQLMNVLRLLAFFNYLFGKSSWGTMVRKGFNSLKEYNS